MVLYLPGAAGLVAVVITWGIAAVLWLIGTAIGGRAAGVEFRIAAGWGALCVVLTLWGVFVPSGLRVPAVALVAVAAAAQLMPRRRVAREDGVALARLLLLTLPLWAVMAGVRPSQVDSFLNLLPNANYLVDYARLPAAAGPPSYSFLPAAPYNTQFLAFLGALVRPDYPAGGMSLANILLRLIGGLALARLLARQAGAPGWCATALGMLLVTLLDPGFVPRFHFSAYGETALAVTALLAAILFLDAQGGLEARGRPAGRIELSLILVAMINSKQSAIGLLLAVVGAAVVTAVAEDRARWRPVIGNTVLVLLPAALLYLVWRYYAARAGVAELEPLPAGEWNWSLLPATLGAIARAIFEKPLYFALELLSFGCLAVLLRRRGWSPATRFLAFNATAFALYNGFILVTYIAHFSPTMAAGAHSYFRYNTHLSLLLVASLALTAREIWPARLVEPPPRRIAATAAIAVALVAPVAFAGRLRFDIAMPQPVVWELAAALKPYLHDRDRLALLLPGDDGEVADLLAGYLADAPPRRRGLDLLREQTADQAALETAAAHGYRLVVISCAPAAIAGVPAGEAGLLRRDGDSWRQVASWPLAAGVALSHWQRNRHWPALCR
ncbi:MAG TPA: hypothetical protein VG651_18730 [Stellaceae bacterium]|nr:hypothetical protein [Stellaceae bacterium]